jgi:hypothetical protein
METLEDVGVVYAAANRKGTATEADLRAFAVAYSDERTIPVKTDNRPLAARSADRSDIEVLTLGGHALRRIGGFDLTGWGVVQTGDWGRQGHRGHAFALEAGHQWPTARWKPWVRVGYDRSSGDDDPADGRHETFFTVLPTPRIYARFPFYTPMNLSDAFVSVILRPDPDVTVRAEYHDLELSEAADLWYAGGGAFDRRTFGFAGRPSGGSTDLAGVTDLEVSWKLSDRTSLTFYQSYARGGDVVRFTFPDGPHANFGYVEATHRF